MTRRLEFRPAAPDDVARVETFNQRLAAAGHMYHRLSIEKPFRTMLHAADSPITVEKLFCFDGSEIRGGVGVKRMMFWVNECPEEVTFSVYPISEGIINPTYAMIGVLIQKELLRRYPLMYSLGAFNSVPAKIKRQTRWFSLAVPFHFRVLRAGSYLRNFAYLRKKTWMRTLLDLAAASGVGTAGLTLFDLFQRFRGCHPGVDNLQIKRFDAWGDWADQVWEKAGNHYTLIGDRSKAALQVLYPNRNDHLIKLRFNTKDTGRLLGWAVITASKLGNHKYFGNMRLGTIVDMLAAPEDAYQVVSGALVAVRQAKADLVIANHSDRRWNRAFKQAGMASWNTNLFLFLSPKLKERFNPIEAYSDRFYFTRGDGHGPTQFWWGDHANPGAAERLG